MMYGHGYYKQSGGYEYEGLFENNQPAKMPSKLVIFTSEELLDSNQNKFEIYEGQNFKVWVRSFNDDEETFQGLLIFGYFLNRDF